MEDALFHKKNALDGNVDNENLTKVIEILRKHGENNKNKEENLAPSILGSLIMRRPKKLNDNIAKVSNIALHQSM